MSQAAFTFSTNDASQRERVLALLSDRRPHSTLEFVRLGVLRISARVMELRQLGYVISCEGDEGRYRYSLRGKGEPPERKLSWKVRALAAEAELARLKGAAT